MTAREGDKEMNNEDGKYGIITTEKKQLHLGEPVFLFRAQDPLTPQVLAYYSQLCREADCAEEHIDAIGLHANRILRWQVDNPTLVKERPGP